MAVRKYVTHSKVVGISFKNEDNTDRQTIARNLNKGDILELRRDPLNIFDKFCIEIFTSDGHKIGFINRELAKDLAPNLDRGIPVTCTISEITGLDKPTVGINILLESEVDDAVMQGPVQSSGVL